MQSLFDAIQQENLFSILASPNKRAYFRALMVVRRCYRETLKIYTADLVSYLIHEMEDELVGLLTDEGEDDGGQDASEHAYEDKATLSGRAHALVRRLVQTGWLLVVPDDATYDDLLLVPDYASRLLDVFHEIIHPTDHTSNLYVYAIYSSLKTANEEREYMYQALHSAYDNTRRLAESLRSLLHNIHRYYQNLQDIDEIRALLIEHFDEYQVQVAAKAYHPLKTVDSVHRFRPRILQTLRTWVVDDEVLRQMAITMGDTPHEHRTVSGGVKGGANEPAEMSDGSEARYEAIRMMQFIIDSFESMDGMLSEIDRRNTNYARASVERIQYLLNADRGIKGKLIEILKHAPPLDSDEPTPIVEAMSELPVYKVLLADPESLYTEKTRRVKEKSRPLKLAGGTSDADFVREALELIERANALWSDQQVIAFILHQMSADGVLHSKDLRLEDVDAYLRTLVAVIKSDDAQFPFEVEWDGEHDMVVVGRYRIPVMSFVKVGDA